jgi:hypothetical protein
LIVRILAIPDDFPPLLTPQVFGVIPIVLAIRFAIARRKRVKPRLGSFRLALLSALSALAAIAAAHVRHP